MIGESVSRSRIFDIAAAEGIPGLFNVRLENGELLADFPTRVVSELVERNGLVPHFPPSPETDEA